ncbi:MAG TPA: DUF4038 domain-containing protein [Tepidisphaeraceae bacterium]|jgi:hypothetical protein
MEQLPLLRVTEDGRGLEYADGENLGRPFIYLADTAWELFHRLTLDEAASYLHTRHQQGFNVYQAVALAELGGLTEPNRNGDLPLIDLDPTRPNEPYWAHIDAVIALADELKLFTALLPTWGDKWNKQGGMGPEIFTPENSRIYGRWIAERYRHNGIIWMLGGNRRIENDSQLQIIRAMATGIRDAVGDEQLITFHPAGGHTSAEKLHDEPWLDFNTIQSGHVRQPQGNWVKISADYARTPIKPILDSEPNYEDHPVMVPPWNATDEWYTDHDVRTSAWRSLLAGAAGYTYGCHDIWQFFDPAQNPPVNHARTPWPEALHLPGAEQAAAIGRLWRSFVQMRRPAPASHRITLVSGDPDEQSKPHAAVTEDGWFAIIYAPGGSAASWAVELSEFHHPDTDVMLHDPVTLDVTEQFPLTSPILTISGENEALWLIMRS